VIYFHKDERGHLLLTFESQDLGLKVMDMSCDYDQLLLNHSHQVAREGGVFLESGPRGATLHDESHVHFRKLKGIVKRLVNAP